MTKTLDGYELKEGEACWVSIQDPIGEHRLSPNPRRANYMDEHAKENGWDFTIKNIRVPDLEVEIIAVWKYRPMFQNI